MYIDIRLRLLQVPFAKDKVVGMNGLQSLLNNGLQRSTDKPVPLFQTGKIFFGKVAKLFANDLALIDVGGKHITAKLETALSVGNGYWLRVQKTTPYPTLKVISETDRVKNGQNVERSIDPLLQQLGLMPSTKHRALVSLFMREGMTFSKALLQQIAAWVSDSDITSHLSTLRTMLAHNLPLQREIFQSLHRFSASQTSLTEQLQALMSELTSVKTSSASLTSLKQQLTALIQNLTFAKNRSALLPFPVKQLIQQLGLHYENSLLHLLQGNVAVRDFEKQVATLKPILMAMLKEELPPSIRETVQELIQRLTGQQLVLKSNDLILNLLFQLPLPQFLSQKDAFIHFQGKQKNEQIDADFCRILFYLDLERLKETIIDVQIQQRIMTIRVFNDTYELEHDLKPLEIDLKKRLEALDYELSTVKWFQRSTQTTVPPAYDSFGAVPRYKGVDLKV